MTEINKLKTRFHSKLIKSYTVGEINHLWRIFFKHITGQPGFSEARSKFQLTAEQDLAFTVALNDLVAGIPYQYIIGKVPFANVELIVQPGVLIPRPETEELVELICSELSADEVSSILDLGSGSGCLAVSLAKYFAGASASAVDISEVALKITAQNAALNQVEMRVMEFDLLHGDAENLPVADLVVSNPPYIAAREAEAMLPIVLDQEPSLALFVPDDDPLLFYRKIGALAAIILSKEGRLYLELNSAYAGICEKLYQDLGWQCRQYSDMSGKERFLKVWR